MTDILRRDFDLQRLSYESIDFMGDNLVAWLRTPSGEDYPYTRVDLMGTPPFQMPTAMREASAALLEFTHECFADHLLCENYPRWIKARTLGPDLFSFSFHADPTRDDPTAINLILTGKEVQEIGRMLAAPLEKLLKDSMICEVVKHNLMVLCGAINPGDQENLGVKQYFSTPIVISRILN